MKGEKWKREQRPHESNGNQQDDIFKPTHTNSQIKCKLYKQPN